MSCYTRKFHINHKFTRNADVIGAQSWFGKSNSSNKHMYKKNQSTLIHEACWENNVEMLAILLNHNSNVNALDRPNTKKYTTMHIAAKKQNVSMMKLLIRHGFDCDKFINNIYYDGLHKSVFLELCSNGNVECMDYLMNECANKIDIWQRDINGKNSLHTAVQYQHLSMVKYLLDNVYKNDLMKRKIFNQTHGRRGVHISCIAAEKGTTRDGLSIFKMLKENKCPMHPHTIGYATSCSSLILEYMLNEQLYPNYVYLSQGLIATTLGNARVHLVHKNMLTIVKYLSNMKDNVSINEYQQWIINIFYHVMTEGTMDGYFKMFKEMIEVLLNADDWKCFTTSKTIDKTSLVNLKQQINNPRNTKDLCDEKWCLLLRIMIDSFDDKTLLDEYDNYDNDENEADSKTNDVNKNDYYCNQNHLMIKINDDNDSINSTSIMKCNYCDELRYIHALSFECAKCKEYVCDVCFNSVKKMIQLLENDDFDQFHHMVHEYKKRRQKKVIKTVEL